MPKETTVPPPAEQGVRGLSVAGFKSLLDRQQIEIRNLTILAGANSSGKSSIMQPLLLLKQTLEAPYDPGSLKLDGPNVRYTAAEQFLARQDKSGTVSAFKVELSIVPRNGPGDCINLRFQKPSKGPITIAEQTTTAPEGDVTLSVDLSDEEVKKIWLKGLKAAGNNPDFISKCIKSGKARVKRNRCFLNIEFAKNDDSLFVEFYSHSPEIETILDIIHLRGLRGNPERQYPVAAFGTQFPGEFERYVAGILSTWKNDKNKSALNAVGKDLLALGLTWKVEARPVSETQVELFVGRMPKPKSGGARDLVSIADVGFGVSQALPVVVALHVARPGQLVYIEQPEIHLHPRAQVAMGGVIARAAQRGVRVVCETHSAHLLLSLQTLVAEESLDPDLVSLNWFTRKEGITTIREGFLDPVGAYGEWPEDFSDVILHEEGRFLDASAARADESLKT
jgi:hypothetical protein